MRVSPRDPSLYLLEPSEFDRHALPEHLQVYRRQGQELVHWVRTYLCRPHAALGRAGSVCPYAEPSLKRSLLWLTIHSGADLALEDVRRAVERYREWFAELEPMDGSEAQYKAIIILFPDLTPSTAADLIERVQAALKSAFVAKGLMIGQFHRDCDERALWNRDFRPLRSPVPLLVIRHMVSTDAAFLVEDASWLGRYLERFGHAVPSRLQLRVRKAALEFGYSPDDNWQHGRSRCFGIPAESRWTRDPAQRGGSVGHERRPYGCECT